MKRCIFNIVGYFLLAIASGITLLLNILMLTSGELPAGEIVRNIVFSTIFAVIVVISIFQLIVWVLKAVKAKSINCENK